MLQLKVDGMTCAHCVAAVRDAVAAVPGAEEVRVDLEHGSVTVGGTPSAQAVQAAIVAEGYDVRAV